MSLTVTWLGHATVVLDVGGVRLISDPLLGRHAGFLLRRGHPPDPSAWQVIDAVLLSHLHHDHAELRSLRRLGNVPVVTAPSNAAWLREHGVPGAIGLQPGEWFSLGQHDQVQVALAPAVHGARPMPHRPNAVNGHFVRHTDGAVWVLGDTEAFPGMSQVVELAEAPIDLAVVPVSGWGPRLSKGHLDSPAAAQVCDLVSARYAIPVHWGTLHPPGLRHLPPGWMDRPGARFADDIHRYAPQCHPVVLAPGQSWLAPAASR